VRGSQEIDGGHDLQVYDRLRDSNENTQGFLEANAHANMLFLRVSINLI
jgi:hypothetical protein